MYEPKADWDEGAAGSSCKWPSMDVYGISDAAKTKIIIDPTETKSKKFYKMVNWVELHYKYKCTSNTNAGKMLRAI